MDELDKLLNQHFAGRVVRKDLTKQIKEGANVPVYVLEYLLGMYCATDDEEAIEAGISTVKNIIADNFVRPDEAEKIKSKIRELGQYTIIDNITVKLNEKRDVYEAEFSNLGIRGVDVPVNYVKRYDKLLGGGIWCLAKMEYYYDEFDRNRSPFVLVNLNPIQLPTMDIDEILEARKYFTKEQWIDVMMRSIGLEPSQLDYNVKWHMLLRLVPLVENNYNLCELGPRSTGKSYVYKEISPNSILVSGGQTTVANLFYNMNTRQVGLVGLWDCVAFDEVAGIKFKDQDGIQIMKDYMASGSFARGKEEKHANASMVFVGNINQSVEAILKTSHLFEPFPDAMANDTAFFDRMHYYLPGWEVPKMRPEHFTDNYGFIVDYISEFFREMRKRPSYADCIDHYYKLGRDLNQRDVIAVRKTVSGMAKLIYPDGNFGKEETEELLQYALAGRRRVKEQLKKIGGMEFYDVRFSYVDKETLEENYVSVPEQGGGKLIPEGTMKPGHIFTAGRGSNGNMGVFKIETEAIAGAGRFECAGLASGGRDARENVKLAFKYFEVNAKHISGAIAVQREDYMMHVIDLQGVGVTSELSLAAFIALCSVALERPVQPEMAVLGSMTIGGTITKVEELANLMQVCFDAGAKRILLPMASAVDIATVPAELFSKFQLAFYESPEDAVIKAVAAD
ncbi:MAG TPA: protease Lon-related BREX system protein BrxL [Bacillota bacterium]|nr:protease Lon-related BREX system protein BrxL [Bacillota bacterium]